MKSARTIISWAKRGAVIAVYLALFGWIAWEPLTFAILKHQLGSITNADQERDALAKAAAWGRLWEVHLIDPATGQCAWDFLQHKRLMNDPEIQVEFDIEWLGGSPFGGSYHIRQRIIDKANIAPFYTATSP